MPPAATLRPTGAGWQFCPFFVRMLIGSGLVARAFESFREDVRVLVFASGVSNSSSALEMDYLREQELLLSAGNTDAHLVYFSTCSVHDPALADSGYIRHKLVMESLVRTLYPHHTIFRLPNLIGQTSNPYTLCNYLRNTILAEAPLHVHANACRYLMDVEEMASACGHMIRREAPSARTVHVCFDHPTPVPELVSFMEGVLGKRAQVLVESSGSSYQVDNASFKDHWTLEMHLPWPDRHHWKGTIVKYYATSPTTS